MTNANYCKDCNQALVLPADGTLCCACESLDADQMRIPSPWLLTADERTATLREEGFHAHACLDCGKIIGYGDNCERDTDHDFSQCNSCASDTVRS